MKKVLSMMVLLGMLVGIFSAPGVALAAEDSSDFPTGEMVQLTEEFMAEVDPAFPEVGICPEFQRYRLHLFMEFKRYLILRQDTRHLANVLNEKRDIMMTLVEEARDNGETVKLARLIPLRIEAEAIIAATKELRSEKADLWDKFSQAVANCEIHNAEITMHQIIMHQQLINVNLQNLINLVDRAIAILR